MSKRLSNEAAEPIQTTFSTACHPPITRKGLKLDQTILVNAAAGGVGSAGIQLARTLGAKVIASAGSDQKLEFAPNYSVDGVVRLK